MSNIPLTLMDLASEYEAKQQWQDAEPIRFVAYDQLRRIYGDYSHYTQKALSVLIQNLRV
jgi:hypothetical protein